MKTILSIFALLSFVFGVYFFIDNRYALSEEVKKISERLDYKIVSDQLQSKQERLWKIMDKFPEIIKMPSIVKEEKLQLEKDKAILEKKLEVLEKK